MIISQVELDINTGLRGAFYNARLLFICVGEVHAFYRVGDFSLLPELDINTTQV